MWYCICISNRVDRVCAKRYGLEKISGMRIDMFANARISQKPYTLTALVSAIRSALESPGS